jgi:hypothetical protein
MCSVRIASTTKITISGNLNKARIVDELYGEVESASTMIADMIQVPPVPLVLI